MIAKPIAASAAATVKINKVKTCPDKSFKYIENETKFILTVAAAEAAIGLAIIVVYFRNSGTIRVEEIDKLKG